MKKILLTGGLGKIGMHFIQNHLEEYSFRIVDIREASDRIPEGVEYFKADLSDPNLDPKIFESMDTIIHLAGFVDPGASFNQIMDANIVSTKNVFEMAFKANCERIVYASSAQAIEGYDEDIQVGISRPVNPKNLYGVSKCFGEALGAYYANQKGISVLCLRIGAYEFPDDYSEMNKRDLSAYLHPDDCNQLLKKCIEKEDLDFEILNAISNNRYKRLDISESKSKLGYEPEFDGFELFSLKIEEERLA